MAELGTTAQRGPFRAKYPQYSVHTDLAPQSLNTAPFHLVFTNSAVTN